MRNTPNRHSAHTLKHSTAHGRGMPHAALDINAMSSAATPGAAAGPRTDSDTDTETNTDTNTNINTNTKTTTNTTIDMKTNTNTNTNTSMSTPTSPFNANAHTAALTTATPALAVPRLVCTLVEGIYAFGGVRAEGIFRVSASKLVMNAMMDRLNTGEFDLCTLTGRRPARKDKKKGGGGDDDNDEYGEEDDDDDGGDGDRAPVKDKGADDQKKRRRGDPLLSAARDSREHADTRSPHLYAHILKYWFMELAEPILPFPLYTACIEMGQRALALKRGSAGMQTLEYNVESLVTHELPAVNTNVLLTLAGLVSDITQPQHMQVNRMTIGNLAIVFAPSFLRAKSMDDPMQLLADNKPACAFIELLLTALVRMHRARAGG